ncbi:MAG: murein L,D-transpeptidase catalytic domain family protein [Flavobacteriales bacterium]
MVQIPLLLVFLLAWFIPGPAAHAPAIDAHTGAFELGNTAEGATVAAELYAEIGLNGQLAEVVFEAGHASVLAHDARSRYLAIADMTQPSTAKRLYVIDLDRKQLVLRTYVAHGSGSGELYASSFSNREGSHQTSLGLYRVGAEIVSPKHGAALLLHGLDKGLNCQALSREVIMHGADYVSAEFIARHGRLGRSWGCPALPRADMARAIELLADGGLLYIHGKR